MGPGSQQGPMAPGQMGPNGPQGGHHMGGPGQMGSGNQGGPGQMGPGGPPAGTVLFLIFYLKLNFFTLYFFSSINVIVDFLMTFLTEN